jgi:hypothetical protein
MVMSQKTLTFSPQSSRTFRIPTISIITIISKTHVDGYAVVQVEVQCSQNVMLLRQQFIQNT